MYSRFPPPYKASDFAYGDRPVSLNTSPVEVSGQQFRQLVDIPSNKRGYRYTICRPVPSFRYSMYREGDVDPPGARIGYMDMSPHVLVSHDALGCTTDKGFRTARANVCVREGDWYWECKIERSGKADSDVYEGSGPHVRVGISRREASLEAPVGYDAYSYGLRDSTGQSVHISRLRQFMPAFKTGDTLGFRLRLPPLPDKYSLSRVRRDRFPIRYKGRLYYEQLDFQTSKDMDELLNPSPKPGTAAFSSSTESKTFDMPSLPDSSLDVYLNGRLIGPAFTGLLPFLPPYSTKSSRGPSLDDGLLGYYPTISVFRGGIARFNFGPTFEYPIKGPFPLSQRYNEQIAEELILDISDECELTAEVQESSQASNGTQIPGTFQSLSPLQNSQPSQPVDPLQPQPPQSVDSIQSTQSSQLVQTAHPLDPQQSQPSHLVQAPQYVEPMQPVQMTDSAVSEEKMPDNMQLDELPNPSSSTTN